MSPNCYGSRDFDSSVAEVVQTCKEFLYQTDSDRVDQRPRDADGTPSGRGGSFRETKPAPAGSGCYGNVTFTTFWLNGSGKSV